MPWYQGFWLADISSFVYKYNEHKKVENKNQNKNISASFVVGATFFFFSGKGKFQILDFIRNYPYNPAIKLIQTFIDEGVTVCVKGPVVLARIWRLSECLLSNRLFDLWTEVNPEGSLNFEILLTSASWFWNSSFYRFSW